MAFESRYRFSIFRGFLIDRDAYLVAVGGSSPREKLGMRRVHRVSLSISLISFLVVGAIPALGTDDGIFTRPDDHLPGQHNIGFFDGFADYHSYLVNPSLFVDQTQDPTCTSLDDPKCAGSRVAFNSLLPFCSESEKINCIAGVGAIDSRGERSVGIGASRFPMKAQNEYLGSPEKKVPSGTSGTLIDIPGAVHDGGSKYLVSVFMSGGYDSKRGVNLENFVMKLTPVKIVQNSWLCQVSVENSCPDSGFANVLGQDGVRRWGGQGPGTDGVLPCTVRSVRENKCAQTFNFPRDFRYFVKVRTNLSPSGWLHGRVFDPAITINSADSVTEINVEASPVWIPIIYKSNFWKDLPEEIRNQYNPSSGTIIGGSSSGFSRIPLPNQTDPLTRNLTITPSPSDSSGMRELQLWLPFLNDRATVVQSSWQVRSLTSTESSGANSCFLKPNELTGIVATNATQYSAGPPTLNSETGSLDYKVASPHLDSLGQPFKGQYSLLMRSNVARCVYGFSNAPIKAELSVISSSGTPQIATLTIGETGGWLRMNAANFGFSTPTIKAILMQDKVESNSPASGSKVESESQKVIPLPTKKKVTITCLKGKSIKKVIGVKPLCPKGYIKKR